MGVCMRLVKCVYCEESINRESDEFIQIQKRYAHYSCAELQERDKIIRRELNELIFQIWGDNVNFGVVGQQIKNFQAQYKYTLSGILGTLHYCYNVKRMNPSRAQGIGIVPFYYKEARSYFENIEKGKINSSELLQNKKISINIAPPKSHPFIKINEIKLEEI